MNNMIGNIADNDISENHLQYLAVIKRKDSN